MNEAIRQEITNRLNRAGKFMLTISTEPHAVVRDGVYVIPEDGPQQCTVLEALILGEPVVTGDEMTDAANILGVERTWLEGFLEGLVYKHGFLRLR